MAKYSQSSPTNWFDLSKIANYHERPSLSCFFRVDILSDISELAFLNNNWQYNFNIYIYIFFFKNYALLFSLGPNYFVSHFNFEAFINVRFIITLESVRLVLDR